MEKKQQVMDLWRHNFHDTEEFIQFYFARKYSDGNSLVYEENGKALSAFLMLPYPMSWQATQLKTSYISGACTQEEARNHGLMTLLLQEAFLEMNKRGIALSTLIPAEDWLFKYYGNLGYAGVFDYSTESYELNPNESLSAHRIQVPETYEPDFTGSLFSYFEEKMQERTCCIQHPEDDYLAIVEDTYLSGGRLGAIFSPETGKPVGWALAFPGKESIQVREILYESEEDKKALLQYFSGIWQKPHLTCRTLPQDNGTERYGMARITDAWQMLQHIAEQHPELSLSLKLYDMHLPVNTGIYLLSNGKCIKKELQELPVDIATDIATLTKALLGYHTEQFPQQFAEIVNRQTPYMNLMLD